METDNRMLAIIMTIGICMILIVGLGTAHSDGNAEILVWRYEAEGIDVAVEIAQAINDYDQMWITFFGKGRQISIDGHPVKTDEIEKTLQYFGITDCWDRISGKLDYSKVLYQLGLYEGNL